MSNDVAISGLKETQQMLVELPLDLTRGSMGPALIAGSVVLQENLLVNAPVGHGPHPEFAPLQETIVTDVEVENLSGIASTGFGDSGPVAEWNEYGHRIVTHSGRDTGLSTAPNPFMRKTTDESADAAIDAFCDRLLSDVKEKYGQ